LIASPAPRSTIKAFSRLLTAFYVYLGEPTAFIVYLGGEVPLKPDKLPGLQ
jgi:hypothetical protein